jgi:DNA-binding NarL/FixJ family response regulator
VTEEGENLYNVVSLKGSSRGVGAPFNAINAASALSFMEGSCVLEHTGNSRRSSLTPREREVVKMIAEGNSAKKIAGKLGLSVKTIEAHRFNLMRKLDIHNKAQLVTYAIQKRIVHVPAEA